MSNSKKKLTCEAHKSAQQFSCIVYIVYVGANPCPVSQQVGSLLYFQVVKICKWVMGRTDGVSVSPFFDKFPWRMAMFSSASFHTKTIKILSRHFSNGNFCFHSFLDFQINYIGDFVRYILDVPISDNLHIRSQLLFVFLHFFCIALSPLPGCIQVSGGF